MDLSRLKEIQSNRYAQAKAQIDRENARLDNVALQETIVKVAKSVVDFVEGNTTKAVVLNQIKDFATHQDSQELISSVDALHDTIKNTNKVDVSELTKVVNTFLEEAKELKQGITVDVPDNTKDLEALKKELANIYKAIKAQKLTAEAPVVNVPETDLSPIKDVEKAVKKVELGRVVDNAQEVSQVNALITKRFDEYRIKYNSLDDDDPRVESITYYLKNKKVAQLKYKYDSDGNLTGGKRV